MAKVELRISIIEIINGIERKRNEVLRERVEILLTLNPGEVLNEFQKGYTWQVTDTDEQRAAVSGDAKGLDTTKSPMPPIPGMVSPSPMPTAPMPSAPNVSRAVGLGLIGKVIAGAAVLVIGAIAIRPFLSPSTAEDPTFVDAQSNRLKGLRANPSRQELEAFVRDNPDSAAVEMAMMVLDSLENETWQAALASNDYERMKNYLDEYPTGNYANEAAYYMDAWNRGDEVAVLDSLIENPEVIKEDPATSPQPDKPKVTKPTKTKPTKKPVTQPNTTDPKPTKPPITKPATEPEKPVPVDPNKPVPFVSAAQKPVYKNCGNSNKEKEEKCTADKIRQFLKSRFEYPREALEKSIEGTVVVSFVVERDGSITDVKALNDIGGGCAKEAVNWVKKLPKFSPGKNGKGTPIRVQYTQPVRFKLN